MAPKRKADVKQQSLEETVEKPPTKVKTRGKEKEVVKEDIEQEDLVRAKMARKHGKDPAFQKRESKAKEEAPKNVPADLKSGSDAEEKPNFVDINRAPVLTAWVTIVAQRQNYSRNSALTFGKAIAGLMANAKGRSIGVISEKEPPDEETKSKKAAKEAELGVQKCKVFGMEIKALTQQDEPRAVESGEKAVNPTNVQQYLARAFGGRLPDVEGVLKELADSFSPDEIGDEAYHLYEQFRPNVVPGQQGWGRKGRLEFDRILELKK